MLFDLCCVLRCLNIILQHSLYFVLHGFLCILIEMHSHTIHCATYLFPECYRCVYFSILPFVCSPFVLMPNKEVPLSLDNEQRQQTPKNSQTLSLIVPFLLLYFFPFIPLLSLSELYIPPKNIVNIRVIGI